MTTTTASANTTKVKCFICLEGGNLKSANICCGPTVYHPACFSRYCSEFASVCPICKKNISDKLQTTNTTTIDWTKLRRWIYGILYGMIVVWSLVMVSLLKKPIDLLGPFIVSCLFSPLVLGIGIPTIDVIIQQEFSRYSYLSNYQGYLIIPNFASYFVLLIACFVSYYHPSLLSTNNVVLIFLAMNNIIPALLWFIIIICTLEVIAVKICTSIYCQLCRLHITTSEITVQDNFVSNV
jgi:hypothetical protein